jgi:aryl-alcohol dehydrogenase-like predicted oxidoreductase
LLDTGDFYGMGRGEMLLREALRGVPRESVFIQVKFGGQRDPRGAFIGYDARPAAVKNSLAYSLQRLGTDYVDLYQPARLDPQVPIEDTVGAVAEMIDAGFVRWVGLSEVGAETIRRAHAVHPISALQIEYSLMSRGIEAEILPTVRELGIGVTAYGILSRGLLSTDTARVAPDDPRIRFPRFSEENLERNLGLLGALEKLARGAGGDHCAAGHRLGRRPGERHRPPDRHQAACAAGRGAGGARPGAHPGGTRRHRGRCARGRRGRRPLRPAWHGVPRQ